MTTLSKINLNTKIMNEKEVLELLRNPPRDFSGYDIKDYCKIFVIAVQNGELEIVNKLLEFADEEQREKMLMTDDCACFRLAAKNGELEIVNKLLEFADEEQREKMFMATRYYAFRFAAINDHLEIVNRLLELATPQQKDAMLMANGAAALRIAAENGHLAIVNALLASTETLEQKKTMIRLANIGNSSEEVRQTVDLGGGRLLRNQNAEGFLAILRQAYVRARTPNPANVDERKVRKTVNGIYLISKYLPQEYFSQPINIFESRESVKNLTGRVIQDFLLNYLKLVDQDNEKKISEEERAANVRNIEPRLYSLETAKLDRIAVMAQKIADFIEVNKGNLREIANLMKTAKGNPFDQVRENYEVTILLDPIASSFIPSQSRINFSVDGEWSSSINAAAGVALSKNGLSQDFPASSLLGVRESLNDERERQAKKKSSQRNSEEASEAQENDSVASSVAPRGDAAALRDNLTKLNEFSGQRRV